MVGRRTDAMKGYEYGTISPSLPIFFALADSLGISPNDLCRQSDNDDLEHWAGRNYPNPPPLLTDQYHGPSDLEWRR